MNEGAEKVDIHRGLSGVYFERSRVTSTGAPASCATAGTRFTTSPNARPLRRLATYCSTGSCPVRRNSLALKRT